MASQYAAFLSYSHSADRQLSAVVQRALQRLAKPWYRRSAIKIFRDEASLSANPGLWSSIEQSLGQCDYFLLMASCDSARSPWVAKEIQWWRTNRPHENLLIIVTDGQIAWDSQSRDFDWERTTCLSPEMKGLHREEPLYVDLRWVKWQKRPGFRDPRFRDAMLMLLAPIYGRPKDELDSEDIRQQRRFQFAAAAAGLVIGILVLATLYGTWNAERNFLMAEQHRREAESRRLAAASLEAMDNDHRIDRAIILGVLAWRIARTSEAESALVKIQSASADVARILGQHTAEIERLAFSGDSSVLATAATDGSIVLWRVKDWTPTGTVLPGEHRWVQNISLDHTGSSVLVRGYIRDPDEDRDVEKTVVWDVRSRTYRILPDEALGEKIETRHEVLSPNGKLVAMPIPFGDGRLWSSEAALGPSGKRFRVEIRPDTLAVWDTTTRTLRAQIRGTPVLAVGFVDDKNLVFLTYAHGNNVLFRAGSWNIDTGTLNLGPFVPIPESTAVYYEGTFAFSGNGSKLLMWYDHDFALWAVQRDMSLARLQRPDKLPREARSGTAIFDQEGNRVLIVPQSGSRMLTWDLSRGKVIKLLAQEYGGFKARLSPDGRWLATVNGARNASVVIWNLDITDSEDPAHSLQAACNLNEGDCIQRLCEKVSLSTDEKVLRDLLGDESFEQIDEMLRTAPCSSG